MLFSQIVEGNRARYSLFLYHRLLTNKHLSISLTAVKEAQSASVADPVFFINHNGDLNVPHQLIGLAKDAGRDVVKLQKCSVEIVYTDKLLPSPCISAWGSPQRG